MSFPSSPVNNQQATINGIIYIFNSTLGAWAVATQTQSVNLTVASIGASGNITGSNITATGNVASGNLSTAGALAVSNNISGNTISISTSISVGGAAVSSTAGEIRATNAITSYYSDGRLKTILSAVDNALDRIDGLHGVFYIQNELAQSLGYSDYNIQVGLLAHDVQKSLREATAPAPFDIAEDGTSISGENYLTVRYERLVPLLVEGIKLLRKQLQDLKESVDKNASDSR